MNMIDFVAAVRQMRQAQKDYFKSRSSLVLKLAKDLEREVDRALEEGVTVYKTATLKPTSENGQMAFVCEPDEPDVADHLDMVGDLSALINQLKLADFKLSVLSHKPGDVFVLRFKEHMSDQACDSILRVMKNIFPDTKTLILNDDVDMEILRRKVDDQLDLFKK